MRSSIFVISFLVLFLVPAFSENACSQELNVKELDYESMKDEVPPEETDDNVFAKATDKQIDEAQDFYEICRNNDTMRARKDCKCAAATFLETRVRLGDEASVEDIIEENVNLCLIDEKKDKVSNIDSFDLEGITEQQLKEAELVFYWCKEDDQMVLQVDCECLAAEFLDLRIKKGPMFPKDIMLAQITQKTCRNDVQAAGTAFQRCMTGTGFKYRGIRPKDYCECYARMWAKLFKDYNGRMDSYKKQALRIEARAVCYRPEYYKK